MEPITLHTPLTQLPKVGPARAAALEKLGLTTVADLLAHFPREYEDRTLRQEGIAALPQEEPVCFAALVAEPFRTSFLRKGMEVTRGRLVDATGQVLATFFNQSYVQRALHPGQTYVFYGKLTGAGSRRQIVNPKFEPEGQQAFTGGILPVYPLTAGLSNHLLAGLVRLALPCADQAAETLDDALRREHQLLPLAAAYRAIHFPPSWQALAQARRRLVFEELFCLTLGLTLLRTRRAGQQAPAFPCLDLTPFTAALPFSLTAAQARSVEEARQDLARPVPMNRLLQGDVGSGKTVVAAACAYLAWRSGWQTALMAPTELLAQQHLGTMETLLGGLGLRVALLSGSLSAARKRACREALAAGEIDLLVGTHALLSQGVDFARLGLVITDEQHRFGVGQRSALAQKGASPHLLVMSATPIPRTLALMVYGDLDISVLDELPPGRQKIETYLIGPAKRDRAFGYVQKHLDQGRQGYLICPLIEEDESGMQSVTQYAEMVEKAFPSASVGVLHGKMKPAEKERVMASFSRGETQLLVSTTVVEVGVDVPNAVIMVIENAERYGLSQLHQLRGRIGRGQHQSTCILITDAQGEETLKRLKLFRDTSDGFKIAEADLKLRGPGDFFGQRQHGLPQLKIADMTTDMEVLRQAQACAKELLAQNALEQPEYKGLRGEIRRLFAKTGGEDVVL